MPNPYEGQHDEKMAPPNLGWHYSYAAGMHVISKTLQELLDAPVDEEIGDLHDYVEALSTLIGFHPRTRDDIERAADAEAWPR